MAFDNLYGLMESHGINSFDDLAQQAGKKEILMGPDPNAADEALYEIIFKHLDDMHSTFGSESAWSRDGLAEDLTKSIGLGRSYRASIDQGNMKSYIIIAGVNGVGKTTLFNTNHIYKDMIRVNLDETVRSFGSWKNNNDVGKA